MVLLGSLVLLVALTVALMYHNWPLPKVYRRWGTMEVGKYTRLFCIDLVWNQALLATKFDVIDEGVISGDSGYAIKNWLMTSLLLPLISIYRAHVRIVVKDIPNSPRRYCNKSWKRLFVHSSCDSTAQHHKRFDWSTFWRGI